jgi:DNA-binding CsgD family transcriptional regulator
VAATRSVVDIVHSSPVVATALKRALRDSGARVGLVVYSWADLTVRVDSIGTCVVVDAYLDDHVPLALKVRALAGLPTTAVVLGTRHQHSLEQRARAEGAAGWLTPSAGLIESAAQIRGLASGRTQSRPAAGSEEIRLTDRELQVMCLYASRRSLNARALARHLGISEATVKSHLKDGRAKYRSAGRTVSNRQLLADALAADGYLVSAETWRAEQRW